MKARHAKAMFYIAAMFNFIAVAVLLPASGIATALGVNPVPDSGFFSQIALLAVFGFGAGYWMVARDPTQNRAVVVLGMFLKLGVVALAVMHYASGTANLNLMVLVSGDLLFALAFMYFLAARA